MTVDPDDISFSLSIELDIPPAPMGGRLMNLAADRKAKLKNITVDSIYRNGPCGSESSSDEDGDFKEFTEKELNTLVIYKGSKICFKNGDVKKSYEFKSDKVTIKEFVDAIVDFEKLSRQQSKWFGGVDCHHTFFEGIESTEEDGVYEINWGS